ncbi:MAG TPA: hypothetical protein VGJ52_01910 [Vicinamibacterales bacterium]|jgi:hypothetical protein
MSINLHSLVALGAAVLLATSALAGQAKPATPATPAQGAPAAPAKFVPPIRGEAQVSMTKPLTKRTATEIITNFKVKNPSTTGSIAGLKISEFWYDKAGNPVSGDEFRYRKPLMPGEVIDVELRSPVNPKMASSQYKFEQANGNVKPTVVAKF